MLYKRIEPDFVFADDRGRLTQLVHAGYTQINVLESNQGVLRGGHYHKRCTEVFFVISGRVKVVFSRGDEVQEKTFGKGDMFAVEPNVVHSMEFEENTLMVVMYDQSVMQPDGQKDIFVG